MIVDPEPPFGQWQQLILRDWQTERSHFRGAASSIYFGGGTPSLVPVKHIENILMHIPQSDQAERTLEANPGDLSYAQLSQLNAAGINRLSLGVQTFQEKFARILGRGTSIALAESMVSAVKSIGFDSWSIDLMFGLPEQSLSELESDLRMLEHHHPPHVSLYGLTYEPGTPFERAQNKGRLKELDEDLWTDQFNLIVSTLVSLGYERYEVSNFALPGHRSRHNESVWQNHRYAGLGPGAHGFRPNGERTLQLSNYEQWLSSSAPATEIPSQRQQAVDAIITWIRHCDGIPMHQLTKLNFTLPMERLRPLIASDAIKVDAEHIVLAEAGWNIVDSITARLAQALRPIGGAIQ